MFVKIVRLMPEQGGKFYKWLSQTIYECQSYHVGSQDVEIIFREGSVSTSLVLDRREVRMEVYAMNSDGETFDKMALDPPEVLHGLPQEEVIPSRGGRMRFYPGGARAGFLGYVKDGEDVVYWIEEGGNFLPADSFGA